MSLDPGAIGALPASLPTGSNPPGSPLSLAGVRLLDSGIEGRVRVKADVT